MYVELLTHDASQNDHSCPSCSTDSSPKVNFKRILMFSRNHHCNTFVQIPCKGYSYRVELFGSTSDSTLSSPMFFFAV